jgi:hypothetical protein
VSRAGVDQAPIHSRPFAIAGRITSTSTGASSGISISPHVPR